MSAYRYRAARMDGGIVAGLVEAASASRAIETLVARGLHPVRIARAERHEERRHAASTSDLALVFRSIASLTGAGVPLVQAVGASEALAGGNLKEALAEARRELREGRGLAEVLELARGVIPPVVVGMLRAGERGSELSAALEEVATHLEQEADLRARVRQALAYPILLLVAGVGSVLLIGTVVIPKFADLLIDLGQRPPLATRVLLSCSAVLQAYGIWIVGGIAAGVLALVQWRRGPAGRRTWDAFLLSVPVIGRVRHSLATARACRALGGLLRSGMPLLSALDAARDAAGDEGVGARLERVRERVATGEPLARTMERERAFASGAQHLIAVGEASGQLALMASRAATLSAQEADRNLRTMVTLLEPAMVVSFGGLVAFVALALLQAVYAIRPVGL
ncbi:MAG TPA: type II secretion system F family protein [Gemmatimonadales bacterium]|nr:type II secretion system F family protein [Gemmatimonadales bacterium]